MRPMSSELREIAERLERVVEAVERGELEASTAEVAYLRGAVDALRVVSGVHKTVDSCTVEA